MVRLLNGNSGETPRTILAIVQARVGSARFPHKVLAEIEGVPMLAHVLRRVKAATFPTHFVLAIPSTPENDPLVAIGEAEGFEVYRGSEDDVLARFWWASQLHPEDKIIVRITADDPLKDPALIDLACELFLNEWKQPTEHSPHYLFLGGAYWPLGMDVEVFSRRAMSDAHDRARDPADREHVTPWIGREIGCWVLKDPAHRKSIATRWTVDEPSDLDLVRAIYAKCYADNPTFGFDAIIEAGF